MNYKDDPVFLKIIPLIFKAEGGYVNNPHDTGGPTMLGVAWNYNADYLKSHYPDIFKQPFDIKRITKEQALQLYYDKYYLAAGTQKISDTDLAYIHLDTAVNCGVGKAREFVLKLSHNPANFDFSDGKNRTLAMTLFLEYTAMRISFYTHARERDTFLEGWMNRIATLIKNSLTLD